jgi:hypothetical protein
MALALIPHHKQDRRDIEVDIFSFRFQIGHPYTADDDAAP